MDLNDAVKVNPQVAAAAVAGEGAEFFPPKALVDERTTRAAALEKEAPQVASFLNEAVALMRARANQEALPIPTPWPEVSEALGGGLWPGLHVLTGATGKGKTQFALQLAWSASGRGVPVLYVGLELGRVDIAARLLALAEGEATGTTPNWSRLFLGKESTATIERLHAAHANTFKERTFRAEFGPPHGWDFNELKSRVAAMRDDFPEHPQRPGELPLLVVLDFLQAIGSPPNERLDLRERISRASYAARGVARDFGAAVLLLSSVSRENAKKASMGGDDDEFDLETNPAELVGMGKESGDIEYAADSVMTLVSGKYTPDQPTTMHLAIAKVRAGTPRWCTLKFDGAKFDDGKARGGVQF